MGNKLLEFKGGSFKAATKAKCPIIPIALIDSFKPFDTNSIAPVTVQVHFLEPLPEADLRAAFADCDFLVLPSVANSEAFGIVQLEAMVYGKPVINTALPTGVPHVSLDGITGLTVAPGDADALAKAMQTLVDAPELRQSFGAAAAERVKQEFEESGVLDAVFRTLEQLTERRHEQ